MNSRVQALLIGSGFVFVVGISSVACADRRPFPPPPPSDLSLESLSPAVGSSAGGETISVIGSGLDRVTAVRLGGVVVSPLDQFPNELRLLSPSTLSVGKHDLVVETADEMATLPDAFEVRDPPTVIELEPDTGHHVGSTEVTVHGEHFFREMLLLIGGRSTTFTYVDQTQVRVTIPAGAIGDVRVEVALAEAGSRAAAPTPFWRSQDGGLSPYDPRHPKTLWHKAGHAEEQVSARTGSSAFPMAHAYLLEEGAETGSVECAWLELWIELASGDQERIWLDDYADTPWGIAYGGVWNLQYSQKLAGQEAFSIVNGLMFCDVGKWGRDRSIHWWSLAWPRIPLPRRATKVYVRMKVRVTGNVAFQVGLDHYPDVDQSPKPTIELYMTDAFTRGHAGPDGWQTVTTNPIPVVGLD